LKLFKHIFFYQVILWFEFHSQDKYPEFKYKLFYIQVTYNHNQFPYKQIIIINFQKLNQLKSIFILQNQTTRHRGGTNHMIID
jgi:hypothetical protein